MVVSKIEAAKWALRKLPTQWRALIQSALRVYLKREKHADQETLKMMFKPMINQSVTS